MLIKRRPGSFILNCLRVLRLSRWILCTAMNGGSHERTLELMQLFAEEVMPHFREDAHVDETAGVGR